MDMHNFRVRNLRVFSILFIFSTGDSHAEAETVYDYQMKRLLKPSKIVRKAEQLRHSVFIYDGLKEADIDKAMQEQFDRVENMMFIRTVSIDESGEEQVDDEGCD